MANTHFSGPVYSTNGFVGDVTGIVAQGADAAVIKADGAIPLTTLVSLVYPADGTDGTGGHVAVTLTLADGEAGQMKIVKYDDGTGTTKDVTVVPANFNDGSQFVLDAAQDTAVLVFDGTNWHTVYSDGTIASA